MKKSAIFSSAEYLNQHRDVRQQLLKLLYGNLYSSAIVIFFNASLFTYVLWPITDRLTLAIWYGLILIVTLLRFVDTYVFFRRERHPYRHWYRRFMYGVLFSALLWGVVPLLFFPFGRPDYQLFVIIILIGMSAGALSTLAADLRLSFIYLFSMLVPLAYRLLDQNSTVSIATLFLLAAFIIIVTQATRKFHRGLVESYENIERLIDAQTQLGSTEKRLGMMFEQAPVGVFFYNRDLDIVDANRTMCQALKVKREQLVGLNLMGLPDQRPMRGAYPDGDFASGPGTYEGPYHSKIHALDMWIKVEFMPFFDEEGSMIGGMAMFADKSKEHEALEQAEFLSLHDPLTMLPNRELLKERIRQTLREQKRTRRYSALLFLDLDRFKQINDSAGHLIGDQLLLKTAQRLKSLLRGSDTLSRLGGDEFVVLLPMLSKSEDEAVRHAFRVAEKIHEALREPYSIDTHILYTSGSIGITTIVQGVHDTDEILRRADSAMYQAKDDGRDRTRFYDPVMDQKARDYLNTQRQLRQAIEDGSFSLYYQPIVHLGSNKIIAAESLLRWQDSDGRFISPAEFIPVAEESGLIAPLGRWVFEEACRQISRWQDREEFNLHYISVNISPRQMVESDFSGFIINTIQRYRVAPERLRLEITETALIQNFEKTKELIEALNAQGVQFIIDDFGTGYSSLSYLKQLSFSALKIDRSFVRDILEDPKDAALICGIIDIARQFNYQVVAEGVEYEAQRQRLMEADESIYYQGYLCSQAVPASEFEGYFRPAP